MSDEYESRRWAGAGRAGTGITFGSAGSAVPGELRRSRGAGAGMPSSAASSRTATAPSPHGTVASAGIGPLPPSRAGASQSIGGAPPRGTGHFAVSMPPERISRSSARVAAT